MIKLRYKLWKTKRGLAPEALFKESLRKELDRAWDLKYGSVPWFQSAWFRYVLVPTTAVFLVIFAGTGAYAYTSPEVTEGNLLYPIKTAVEKVEEKLSVTPKMKTQFYIRQLDRRYQEAAAVGKKIKTKPANTVIETVKVQAGLVEKINQVEKKLVEQKQVIPSNTLNEVKLKAKIQDVLKESEVKKRLIVIPTTTIKIRELDPDKMKVNQNGKEKTELERKLEEVGKKQTEKKELRKLELEKVQEKLSPEKIETSTSLLPKVVKPSEKFKEILERAKSLLPVLRKDCNNCYAVTSTPAILKNSMPVKVVVPTSTRRIYPVPSTTPKPVTSTQSVSPYYKPVPSPIATSTIKYPTTTIRVSPTTTPKYTTSTIYLKPITTSSTSTVLYSR